MQVRFGLLSIIHVFVDEGAKMLMQNYAYFARISFSKSLALRSLKAKALF